MPLCTPGPAIEQQIRGDEKFGIETWKNSAGNRWYLPWWPERWSWLFSCIVIFSYSDGCTISGAEIAHRCWLRRFRPAKVSVSARIRPTVRRRKGWKIINVLEYPCATVIREKRTPLCRLLPGSLMIPFSKEKAGFCVPWCQTKWHLPSFDSSKCPSLKSFSKFENPLWTAKFDKQNKSWFAYK